MTDVAAAKPKTVKPKGEKKPTTAALIKEAILALKVESWAFSLLCCKYCPEQKSEVRRPIVECRDVCSGKGVVPLQWPLRSMCQARRP